MEISLLIGIVFAFLAFFAGYTMEGGALISLLLISPFIIVVGGTVGAAIASYPFKDFFKGNQGNWRHIRNQNSNNTKLMPESHKPLETISRTI